MTLNELSQKIESYLLPLRQSPLRLAAAVLLCAVMLGLFSLTRERYYQAKATFKPEENKSQDLSLDPALAAFFGGAAPSSTGNQEIIGVLLSRKISELVASDSILLDGKKTLVADAWLLRVEGKFNWSKPFKARVRLEDYGYQEKVTLAGRLMRAAMKAKENEYKFIDFLFASSDQELTGLVSQQYLDDLIEHYNLQKTQKARRDLEFFTHRADSIKEVLDGSANYVASFYDTNKYRTQFRSEVGVKKKEIEVEYLRQIYQQLVLSREQARTQLLRDTPIISILDAPKPPFKTVKPRPWVYALGGAFLGFFLMALWIVRPQLKADITGLIEQSLQPD